jgi:hypothetical protein
LGCGTGWWFSHWVACTATAGNRENGSGTNACLRNLVDRRCRYVPFRRCEHSLPHYGSQIVSNMVIRCWELTLRRHSQNGEFIRMQMHVGQQADQY